jgi:hypothetical protein
MNNRIAAIGLLIAFSAASIAAQSQSGAATQDHDAMVHKNGDAVMGFSQDKATHHFRLYKDGGAIEVTANDAKDTETRDTIRMHLGHIAKMFAEGNFEAPMLIHGQVPPGVTALQRLKEQVTYRFEELPRGGQVVIATSNEEALKAAHEFLRFQISDHKTGDALTISTPDKNNHLP